MPAISPQASATHAASRRQVLRGLGTFLTLPFLESLGGRAAAVEKGTATVPLRACWLYVPNGVNVDEWMPQGDGAGYQLSRSLKELERHRDDFMIMSGLSHDLARAHGNGGGDHARATATFLTGCMPKKTAGADIQLGISVDQIAAEKIGNLTRLPSLELSTDGQRNSGNCDSGYSCAYQFNLSWKSATMPMAPEMNPRLAFERLFGYGAGQTENGVHAERRKRLRKSVLDTVLGEAKSLQARVNPADRRKVDEYFVAVRDIEQRIESAEKFNAEMPDVKVPDGVPSTYEAHIRAMFDILVLAFQTDSTRIASFMLAHDGSNRSFPEIGVPDSHHSISHHQRDPQKLAKLGSIDRFYLRQLAYFLDKMKSIQEGEKSLLDSSMIVYGGGIQDPDRHNHENLPIILAGRAGGGWTPGRRQILQGEVPMTNLYVDMLQKMNVHVDTIGDSSGRLEVS